MGHDQSKVVEIPKSAAVIRREKILGLDRVVPHNSSPFGKFWVILPSCFGADYRPTSSWSDPCSLDDQTHHSHSVGHHQCYSCENCMKYPLTSGPSYFTEYWLGKSHKCRFYHCNPLSLRDPILTKQFSSMAMNLFLGDD